MNIEWNVVIEFFTVEDDLFATESRTLWAPTLHAAVEEAQRTAEKIGKVKNADYWLVHVD